MSRRSPGKTGGRQGFSLHHQLPRMRFAYPGYECKEKTIRADYFGQGTPSTAIAAAYTGIAAMSPFLAASIESLT